MRCKACNVVLNDTELKRKDRDTGEFYDLCGTCLFESDAALEEAKDDCEYFTNRVDAQ